MHHLLDSDIELKFWKIKLFIYFKRKFILKELARNEVDEILRESNGKMGMAEIQRFAYLERCIKEALRLYPSVPFISRTIRQDLQLSKQKQKQNKQKIKKIIL